MEKLVLHTGLFDDADIIIKAADAPVKDLTQELSSDEWDEIVDEILEADLVVTA
ncbi:hypothetical protein [Terasakiella sp. SH-1]|uniref:hypothetical protein n=1 Tax=Terasakiella sp. SH-1 TaxID=2560057 RepID=UPI0014315A0A|nr:hypothetical protein [Terasakiella sp. SH-1]